MLNISQLTFTIDSLNKKYNEKVNAQFRDFKRLNSILQSSMYNSSPSPSGKTENSEKPGEFDTKALFDSLTVSEKRTVLAKAIENLKDGNSVLVEKNESQHYEIKTIKKYEVEWNKKLTMSFACLVFFLYWSSSWVQ